MFYSKSNNGFYDSVIHGNAIPEDAVEITTEQHVALIQGQSEGKRIVADRNGCPMLTDPPQASITEIWEFIHQERDHRTNTSGYKVDDKWFHSDPKSRNQQLSLVLLGGNIPADLQWKTMDGSFVTMTPQLAREILAASTASDQAIFAAAETHRAAMEASAEPASYDFSKGWPEAFSN